MAADTKPRSKAARLAQERERAQRRRRVRNLAVLAVVLAAVVAGLYTVFNRSEQSSPAGYEVGSPGPGQSAPGFALASSSGKTTSLGSFKGKTVLLYFQEGLTCQPCWDEIRDLEKSSAKVKAARIDQIVSLTTDPSNLIARKVKDEGLTTPVLSDPDLKVSKAYEANQYGMMGTSRDGHSFVLVGPDGKIKWRADYGGAPKYTMYVAVDKLLADLKAGRQA